MTYTIDIGGISLYNAMEIASSVFGYDNVHEEQNIILF